MNDNTEFTEIASDGSSTRSTVVVSHLGPKCRCGGAVELEYPFAVGRYNWTYCRACGCYCEYDPTTGEG